MARLLFIGRLEDVAGSAEREIRLEGPVSLNAVLARLSGELAEELSVPKIRLALNGTLVPRDGLTIGDSDEVAFLPPVSGG